MRNDRRGIEGLPLRLMLVALLISLTLPSMLSFMNNATSSIAEGKAAEVAEHLAATVERMSAGGPGNVRIVSVPGDLMVGTTLRVGGENGTVDSARITWNAEGRQGARYLEGVVVLTGSGEPLTLSAGDTIRLECLPGTRGTVEVTRA